MIINKAVLFALSFVSAGLLAQSSQLTWMNGENTCTGKWSYTKLGYCGYQDDPNSPIYATIIDVSHAPNTCQTWGGGYDVVDNNSGSVEWEDSIVAQSCSHLKPGNAGDLDQWVQTNGIPIVEGPWNGRCQSRNKITKKCESHHKVYRGTCNFERRIAKSTTDGNLCGTHEVHSPRQVTVGYNKLQGYHPNCPGAQSASSAYLFNKTLIVDPSVDMSTITCSTLDEIQASSDDIIRKKFDAHMNLSFEISALEGQCDLKRSLARNLNEIANYPGSQGTTALTDEQYELVFAIIDGLNDGCKEMGL